MSIKFESEVRKETERERVEASASLERAQRILARSRELLLLTQTGRSSLARLGGRAQAR